jgi:transmembrane sensor
MSHEAQASAANQGRIDEEAADWLLRRSERQLGLAEEAEFERWLAAHPQHTLTFSAMSGVWAHAGTLKHLAHFAELGPRVSVWQRLRHSCARRPWVPAAIGAVAAAAIVFAIPLMTILTGTHSTAVGEMRTVALPDGSTVYLGAKSRIRVKFSDAERRVQLVSGEALFEVQHNPARPFVVDAGDELVRDVGTRFDINRSDSSVRVFVLQGSVEISDTTTADIAPLSAAPQVLKAGDGLEATHRKSATAKAEHLSYAESPDRAPDAWRTGWLIYENATLGDVVADVNRYYGPGVTLAPEVAEMRLTASIRTAQISAFLGALHSALPVQVARESDGRIHVTQR